MYANYRGKFCYLGAHYYSSQLNKSFEDFIEGLNIPKLGDEEQHSLEKDLTMEEIKDSLTSFADNRMDLRRNSMKPSLSFFATTFLIVTTRHFGMGHFQSLREGVLLHLFLKAMSMSQI